MTVANEVTRADLIATAATKADFDSWCIERIWALTEEWKELFRELVDEVKVALRIVKKHPLVLSEREQEGWRKRNTKIKIELFRLSFEIGLLVQSDKYLPFVLRRWRESQLEK